VRVLPPDPLQAQSVQQRPRRPGVRVGGIGPERPPCFGGEAGLVGVAVLGDDRRDALRVPEPKPPPDGRAVVLDVDGVAVKPERVKESDRPKPSRSGATTW
jgi:hypothetical protein